MGEVKRSPNAKVREDRKQRLIRVYRHWQREEAENNDVMDALGAWIDGTHEWPLPPIDGLTPAGRAALNKEPSHD